MPSLGTGGAERVGAILSNHLSKKYDVEIILLNHFGSVYELEKSINLHYAQTRIIKNSNILADILRNLIMLKRIYDIIIKINPSLIISLTTTSNIYCIFFALIGNRKSIISERSNPEDTIPNIYWRILRNIFYRYSDLLIVQSELSLNYFSSIIHKKKICILTNPLDVNLYNKKDFYSKKENIILTVGRLDTNKNQELLIRAFAKLNISNWRLLIIGDGVMKNSLKELCKKLKIDDRVDFLGNIPNVWKFYNLSKIFVLTSRSEGFPNVLLEAAMFGIPIVSSNCKSGPSEVVKNSINGFLFDVDNIEQLVDKLNTLTSDNITYDRILKNSIFSSKIYNPEVILQHWESEIYKIFNA